MILLGMAMIEQNTINEGYMKQEDSTVPKIFIIRLRMNQKRTAEQKAPNMLRRVGTNQRFSCGKITLQERFTICL
jgi:hypothetical protein